MDKELKYKDFIYRDYVFFFKDAASFDKLWSLISFLMSNHIALNDEIIHISCTSMDLISIQEVIEENNIIVVIMDETHPLHKVFVPKPIQKDKNLDEFLDIISKYGIDSLDSRDILLLGLLSEEI
jgi:hypothetical protein